MIKTMIIDDEISILHGLKLLIDWKRYGFEIIDTATIANEAYEKICRLNPDVVITDIRLPDLSGLDLLNMILKSRPEIKSIVISGYQDFEYAKQAIACGAVNYLLKPIDKDELLDTIKKVGKMFEKKYEQPGDSSNKAGDEESLLILRFFSSLLTGMIKNREVIEKKLEDFNISFDFKDYYTLVVALDMLADGENENGFSQENMELIGFAAVNIIEEILSKHFKCIVLDSFNKEIIAVIATENSEYPYIMEILKKIQRTMTGFLKTTTTMGISKRYHDVLELSNSYNEAKNALKYKLLFDKNSIIQYESVLEFIHNNFKIPVDIEKKIVNSVLYNEPGNMDSLVSELFKNMEAQKASPEKIHNECVGILMNIQRHCVEFGIDLNAVINGSIEKLNIFIEHNYLIELQKLLYYILIDISKSIAEQVTSSSQTLIIRICDYIKKNYAKQISLKTMGEKFFISPSYISKLFKEKTDNNFLEYLTRIRIEEAKKLLLNTEDKIYEIAQKVGYGNAKYFSQLFEKQTGLSPRDYREKMVGRDNT